MYSYISNRTLLWMSQYSVYIPAVWISLAVFRGGECYPLTGSQLSNNKALFTLATAKGVVGLSEKTSPTAQHLYYCLLHTLLGGFALITECVKTRQLLTKHTRLHRPQTLSSNRSHIRWRRSQIDSTRREDWQKHKVSRGADTNWDVTSQKWKISMKHTTVLIQKDLKE